MTIRLHLHENGSQKWSVSRPGAARALRVFDATDYESALRFAEERAEAEASVLFIFGDDGRISRRISYTKEPAN